MKIGIARGIRRRRNDLSSREVSSRVNEGESTDLGLTKGSHELES